MPTREPSRLHPSVLVAEVLELLQPKAGGHCWVDATLGTAGHSCALLEAIGGDGALLGIERDPELAALARRRLEATARALAGRLDAGGAAGGLAPGAAARVVVHVGVYRDLPGLLEHYGLPAPHGIIADFGANFLQLTGERGVGFHDEAAPLDGRYNPGEGGMSIAEFVNTAKPAEIARVLWEYGDEQRSRRIAQRIESDRRVKPFETVGELARVIRSCFPAPRTPSGLDVVTRSWQALRIHVNGEVEHMREGLAAMLRSLAVGGRLAVLSFHSLEARIVKDAFNEVAGRITDPTNLYTLHPDTPRDYRILTKKAIVASDEEQARNPGSRSAQLRAIERIAC